MKQSIVPTIASGLKLQWILIISFLAATNYSSITLSGPVLYISLEVSFLRASLSVHTLLHYKASFPGNLLFNISNSPFLRRTLKKV